MAVVARVYAASCESYDAGAIAAHLTKACGVLDVSLPATGTPLIHPSLPFAHSKYAPRARTCPEVIEGIGQALKGSTVTVGAQSLPGFPTRYCMGKAGYRPMAGRMGARLAEFDELGFAAPKGAPAAADGSPLPLSASWLGASFRISAPRLMGSTFVPFAGPLLQAWSLLPQQTQLAEHGRIQELVAPLAAAAKPDLVVVDAIDATHKGGELAGEDVHLGVLLVGTDPVAVELAAGALYGVPDADMGYACSEHVASLADVEIVGDLSLDDLRARSARVQRLDPNPEVYELPSKLRVVRSSKSRLAGSAGSLTEAFDVLAHSGLNLGKSREVTFVLGAVDEIPRGTTDKSTIVYVGDTARGEASGYSRVVRLAGRNVAVSQVLMDLPFVLDIGNFRTDLGFDFTIARILAGVARRSKRSQGARAAARPPQGKGGDDPAVE